MSSKILLRSCLIHIRARPCVVTWRGYHYRYKWCPSLDMEYIRNNQTAVRDSFSQRNLKIDIDLDAVVAGYDKRVSLDKELAAMKEIRIETNKEIFLAKTGDDVELFEALKQKMHVVAEKIKDLKVQLDEVIGGYILNAARIPNTISKHTPIGDYSSARLIRTFGKKRSFDFKPLGYKALGMQHRMFDVMSGLQTTGPATVFLRGEAALLELALVNFTFQFLVDRGFEPVLPPDLVRCGLVEASGFETRSDSCPVYRLGGDDDELSLSGTSELQLAGMCSNSARQPASCPQRFVARSHCFRREAKQPTTGLYRMHQFTKVEMFGVTDNSEEASNSLLMEFADIQVEILDKLGLHGRLLEMPSFELGKPAYRKLDAEVWMANDEDYDYREVCSASNCVDYQARRLEIYFGRYSVPRPQYLFPDREYCHTVNGTGIAVPRVIIALLETHQLKDGSIMIPECLRPFLGGREVIAPPLEKRKHTFHGDTSVRPLH